MDRIMHTRSANRLLEKCASHRLKHLSSIFFNKFVPLGEVVSG